jgi:hypothetical protein
MLRCLPRVETVLPNTNWRVTSFPLPRMCSFMYMCMCTYTARTHACRTRRFLCNRPHPHTHTNTHTHTHTHTHTRRDTHTHTVSCYCCCRYALVRSMSSSTRTVSSYAGPTQSPKSPFNLQHVRAVDPKDRVRFQVSTRKKTNSKESKRNQIANRQSTQECLVKA